MEQNSSKKVLLSVLGVAILIVAVVGISFAALSFDKTGETNSITTGTITMSFSESTNGIYLKDALPMNDDVAIQTLDGDGEYFLFSVTTTATNPVDIDYEINVTPQSITASETVAGALTNGQVKVYLEKSTDGSTYSTLVGPTLVSALETAATSTRTGAIKVTDVTDSYVADDFATTDSATKTTYYRLRMWVDESVDTGYLSATEGKHYEYKLIVNINATADALGA